MIQKDYIETLTPPTSLIQDEYYFKYIFKKTEKVVCAVFYILSNTSVPKDKEVIVADVSDWALGTLACVGASLARDDARVYKTMRALSQKLVLLESKLRVLHATQVLHTDHLNVFVAEIDGLLRSVRSYESAETGRARSEIARVSTGGDSVRGKGGRTVRAQTRERSAVTPSVQSGTQSTGSSRRERISAVLGAQPQATIKDISDTVDDWSEKTIQRELNDMIAEGIVVREGERRWSRYSLAK